MDFYEMLERVLVLLQRHGRLSYRALKRQFDLDDDTLEDLKEELFFAHPVVDEAGRGLVWTGDETQEPTPRDGKTEQPSQDQERDPTSYTPQHLAEKILTSRSTLEGERKQVTVMFCDIKGSTELIRDLDPEAAQQLLDPAIHIMMDAVHRYEGTVNQVLGDGIMALFGAPLSHEDHAVRACYAALAMQDAMRDYSETVRRTHGMNLQIRVGLNSGEVVLRTIGSDLHMDYSAVGPSTHLAARMEQLANRAKEAVPLLEQAIEQFANRESVQSWFRARFALGDAYLQADQIDAAQFTARTMLAQLPEDKRRGFHAYTRWLLGEIARHGDSLPATQAESDYRQALALTVELGMRPLQAHCHLGLGTLYRQTGQSEQARAELFTAIEMYHDMEMTFWLPETETALAEVEGKA